MPELTEQEREMEIRSIPIEVRAENDDTRTITGRAVVYDTTITLGHFFPWKETIAKGAATKSVDSRNQFMLWQHSMANPLASVPSSTLQLTDKDDGVHFTAQLPDTQQGRDAYELIRKKIVREMSSGFIVKREQWANLESKKKKDHRTIIEMNLIEISIVTRAAYPQAKVAARMRELAYQQVPRSEQDGQVRYKLFTIRKKLLTLHGLI